MLEVLPAILAPVLVTIIFVFLTMRLGFFTGKGLNGRWAFAAGGVLLLGAAVWEAVKSHPRYPEWFLSEAYAYLDLAQFALVAAGLILAGIGLALYADYWQSQREELDARQGKLSLLENLQHDARQPYHLLEMLEIGLREVLMHFPMAAGAVFMVNRSRRQFVLTTSSGLQKEEVAYLEYYPLERNVVSQAVELGDPMLLGHFDFYDRQGQTVASRFKSCLILPLVSGLEKIGGLVLLSEDAGSFSRGDVRYLTPVAQWLAEIIKSARLTRELTQSKASDERRAEALSVFLTRVTAASRALISGDPVPAFCRSLVGLAASNSVHLCGIRRGELQVYGGSRPLFDLSENYKAALVETIGRGKPLIINQESQADDERANVVLSTLVYPLPSSEERDALVLQREDRPFTVCDDDLKQLEALAGPAGWVLVEDEHHRFDLTRRKGFECVIKLLETEEEPGSFGSDPGYLPGRLIGVLPSGANVLAFERSGDELIAVHVAGQSDRHALDGLRVHLGEGGLGRAAADRNEVFVAGRSRVLRDIESYREGSRTAWQRLFGESVIPGFVGYCPVLLEGGLAGLVMVTLPEVPEAERGEWERMITLAVGLYSLRLNMQHVPAPTLVVSEQREDVPLASAANDLNNLLSVVVGNAELLSRDRDFDAEQRANLRRIVESAEQAADLLRAKGAVDASETPEPPALPAEDINDVITRVLDRNRVSGNLFMAGQRAREIRARLGQIGPVRLASRQIEELFQSVVNRFSLLAEEEDVITVATYRQGDYVYLDVSRHHPSFPAVDRVADFGQFAAADESFDHRPSDIYLRHLTGSDSAYAVDLDGPVPAYLSFKFPVGRPPAVAAPTAGNPLKLLAIDDQRVILDLITAMGQSLGYEVRTAASGEDGLKLFRREDFDLVLTDLALPGISGLEVARQVRRIQPAVPIILVTGWASDLNQTELDSAGVSEVLYKPFRIEQLTEAVQKVLAQTARF